MEKRVFGVLQEVRYSTWVVVDFLVLRDSCNYLYDIDRNLISIALILNVWFQFTNTFDILRLNLLEFHFNRSNSTSKLYNRSTEDIELVK